MKKSSSILLTLLISFTVSLSSAQTTQQDAPNVLICPEDSICMNTDTLECDSPPPQVTYNYYFRIRFFDHLFRRYFPHRYNTLVYGIGHVSRPPIFYNPGIPPHRSGSYLPMASARRGGFGRIGSGHSQSN